VAHARVNNALKLVLLVVKPVNGPDRRFDHPDAVHWRTLIALSIHQEHGSRSDQGNHRFGIKVVEKFLSNRLFNKLEKEKGLLASYVGKLFDNPTLPVTMLSGD
jgi:hypothetical protein